MMKRAEALLVIWTGVLLTTMTLVQWTASVQRPRQTWRALILIEDEVSIVVIRERTGGKNERLQLFILLRLVVVEINKEAYLPSG